MAIDPTTAKLITQIAIKAAADKETQKRIFTIILVITISLLLIIAFIVYILSTPLGVFAEFIFGEEIKAIEVVQDSYGYNVSVKPYPCFG